MKKTILSLVLLFMLLNLYSQTTDNYFYFNGGADVLFRYKARGTGGRALVHDANNSLTLNYGNDFTGGLRIGSNTSIDGDLLTKKLVVQKNITLQATEEINGWRNSYFYYPGHSLTITIPDGQSSHTALELKPGSSDIKRNESYLNLYESNGLNNYTKKIQISSSMNTFFNGGNIGIGTENPTEKLDVRGAISATEVKVQILSGADHVFNQDYDLKPLSEVESFIEENKHLPEIPSEKQMQENGLSMNEFQIKLLQKIEELTLYTIKQEKRLNEQQALIEKQSKRIEQLENK